MARDLIHEAARRLEKGHGLKLGRAADADRIQGMVSDATWTLLGVEDDAHASPRLLTGRAVPLARLDDIFDDLERL